MIKFYEVTYIDYMGKQRTGKWEIEGIGKQNHDDGILVDQLVKNYIVKKIISISEISSQVS